MTPVFFVGHGSPMNALEENPFTESLRAMRALCPSPRAVLVVSAHWLTEGTWVTQMPNPRTIHDFYGFPQALFDVQYPAPGSAEVADLVRAKVASPRIQPDHELWGFDHGTWAVMRHMFPEAKVPVLQLSLNIAQPAAYHRQLGEQLRALREEGILIVGSGNIVHNLREIRRESDAPAFPWALEFDAWSKQKLLERDWPALEKDFWATEAGKLSVPTTEHYYPLLYVLGAAHERDELRFTFEGMQNASISMRSLALVPKP